MAKGPEFFDLAAQEIANTRDWDALKRFVDLHATLHSEIYSDRNLPSETETPHDTATPGDDQQDGDSDNGEKQSRVYEAFMRGYLRSSFMIEKSPKGEVRIIYGAKNPDRRSFFETVMQTFAPVTPLPRWSRVDIPLEKLAFRADPFDTVSEDGELLGSYFLGRWGAIGFPQQLIIEDDELALT